MQYTDNEATLIGGLISTYFFQPAVSASLKDAYSRVLEHLHQNALTSSDLQQIRKAVNFLIPMCQASRQTRFCDRVFLCPELSDTIDFFSALLCLLCYLCQKFD